MEYSWRRIVRSQTWVLSGTTVVAVLAGLALRGAEHRLFDAPWILALIPVINAVGGNLGSVLGSRLTSALHLGTISTVRDRELRTNLAATGAMALSVYVAVALLAWALAPRLGLGGAGLGLFPLAGIVLGAGAFITLGVIGLSLGAAFIAFRRGLDPDDVVVPVVATFADLLGVVAVIVLSGVLL
jgi:mgtE-like transporter